MLYIVSTPKVILVPATLHNLLSTLTPIVAENLLNLDATALGSENKGFPFFAWITELPVFFSPRMDVSDRHISLGPWDDSIRFLLEIRVLQNLVELGGRPIRGGGTGERWSKLDSWGGGV